jgi:ketosteroid isomerase-like protein
MKKVLALLLNTSLLAVFCATGFSREGDSETLKKLNRAFLDALVNKDSASLCNILADDFLLINPGGVKITKADNLATLRLPNQRVISIDVDSIQVRLLTADVGLVTVWTNSIVEADGKKAVLKICYQDTYLKRNKNWKAVAAHVTLLSAQ